MTRPTYETAADRAGEKAVIMRVADAWGSTAHEMPPFYQVDWGLSRQRLEALVEIKRRRVPHDRYPTLILSAHKLVNGLQYAQYFNVKFILIVEYTDGLFFWVAEDIKPELRIGGRYDRGDPHDCEPVAHLPTELFKPVRRINRALAA